MPIYEYRCAKCGEFEVTQRITDAPLKRCPTCRNKVTKLISSTSFQLKGSGWYVTDYARSGAKGPAAKGDSDAATKTEKTEATASKTEKSETSTSKPAETKTTKAAAA